MSELEAATIAFQNATIAFQNASLEISRAGLWATYVQAGVAGLVGLAQCALIAYGLKLMQRGNADRVEQNQLLSDRMEKQNEQAQKRHEENMLALRTLIERTAPR